ncbi:MAG: saccharopine dehydrogenase NADP-binding domain-containing protein, partial [Bacteroidota bacterium]
QAASFSAFRPARVGLKPRRNAEKLAAWADEHNLPYRVISLSNQAKLEAELANFSLVLHAAGPYSKTYRPMVEACLATQTHYIDITGEVDVFEEIAALSQAAKDTGIVLLPGAGFDVVPTDCLASFLAKELPDANSLELAFRGGGGPSRGTAKTAVENLGAASKARINGRVVEVPLGRKTRVVPFRSKDSFVMTIPWGDVSTAFYTTGIPNIETYMGISPKSYRYVKWQKNLAWLLRMNWVRSLIARRVERGPSGPSDATRASSKSQIWGLVTNAKGESREGRLEVPNGYTLTAQTSIDIAIRILNGEVKPGFWTPAGAFGANFILDFGGKREKLDEKGWILA